MKKLEKGTCIQVILGGGSYNYEVFNDHCSCKEGTNDIIFEELLLDKKSLCERYYGYLPRGGDWPEAESGDFDALTRVWKKLTEIIHSKGGEVILDGITVGKTTKIKTTMRKITNMFKTFTDAGTQSLRKVEYLDGDLEITSEGTTALLELLFIENKDKLVAKADEAIAEEEKASR